MVIGLRAALWLLTLGVRLLAHDVGRRLLAALVVIAVCAGLVTLVFTYPEPVEPESASAPPMAPAARSRAASKPNTPQPAARPVRPAGSPEQAAATWYAQHKRLRRDQVRVLQRDQVSTKSVRVLVLGDGGNGRLDTAVVTVRRTGSGWQVDK